MVAPLPSFVRNWFYGTMLVAGCQYFGMGNRTTPYILSLNAGVLACLLFIHFFKPEMMPDVMRDPVPAQVSATTTENQAAGNVEGKSDSKTTPNKKSKKTN
ncbi:hypothetical protein BC943DRAFT_380682 [Umbelopsis sp. AD052]|nr:hypothetical protein BC943DRAFT_380682 [Umbelopsis sp. AD052]